MPNARPDLYRNFPDRRPGYHTDGRALPKGTAMSYDLRIVHGLDFVRLDAEGHFDLPATRQIFSDIIWACVRSHIGHVLVDVRDAATDMTAAQVASLALVCNEVSPPPDGHKIAILTRRLDRAGLLAAEAQEKGWKVEAFYQFEPAFEWLSC